MQEEEPHGKVDIDDPSASRDLTGSWIQLVRGCCSPTLPLSLLGGGKPSPPLTHKRDVGQGEDIPVCVAMHNMHERERDKLCFNHMYIWRSLKATLSQFCLQWRPFPRPTKALGVGVGGGGGGGGRQSVCADSALSSLSLSLVSLPLSLSPSRLSLSHPYCSPFNQHRQTSKTSQQTNTYTCSTQTPSHIVLL